MTQPVPPQPGPLRVSQNVDEITLGCTGCDAELRCPSEPTSRLLEAIEAFVREHARCT